MEQRLPHGVQLPPDDKHLHMPGHNTQLVMHTHTHTHSVLTTIFPGEPGLADCPVNSPPFIPGLRILLGQA